MDKELNPSKGELELDENLNLDEEDSEDEELEFEEDEDESDEESEEESEEESDEPSQEDVEKALKILNLQMQKQGLNKNYKNFDDVVKSEKAKDDAFSQKKVPMEKDKEGVVLEKNEEQPPVQQVQPSNMSERLLRLEKPESVYVIEEIKRDHPGKDVLEVYENYQFYQKEAAVRAEAEKAKNRISNPSGGVDGPAKTVADKLEAEFMDESTLPPGFKFLPTKKK